MKFLDGKKTYIGTALLAIMALIDVGTGWGWYDIPEQWFVIVGSLTAVSLRVGIKKAEPVL